MQLARPPLSHGDVDAVDRVAAAFTKGGATTWEPECSRSPQSRSADEIDRILGCVLTYSDENFDPALAIGFASSIRKEWAWRVKRGESLANLRAFARLADPEHDWAAGD